MHEWPTKAVVDLCCGFLAPAAMTGSNASVRHRPNADLPQDFADYLVYVTRQALIGTSQSLRDASTQAHNFFQGVHYNLACDRMVRSFAPWMPTATLFWPGAAASPWLATSAPIGAIAPFSWPSNPWFGPPRSQYGFPPSFMTPPYVAALPRPTPYVF